MRIIRRKKFIYPDGRQVTVKLVEKSDGTYAIHNGKDVWDFGEDYEDALSDYEDILDYHESNAIHRTKSSKKRRKKRRLGFLSWLFP